MTTIATTKTRTAIATLAAAFSFAAVAGPVAPDAQAAKNAANAYQQTADAKAQAKPHTWRGNPTSCMGFPPPPPPCL